MALCSRCELRPGTGLLQTLCRECRDKDEVKAARRRDEQVRASERQADLDEGRAREQRTEARAERETLERARLALDAKRAQFESIVLQLAFGAAEQSPDVTSAKIRALLASSAFTDDVEFAYRQLTKQASLASIVNDELASETTPMSDDQLGEWLDDLWSGPDSPAAGWEAAQTDLEAMESDLVRLRYESARTLAHQLVAGGVETDPLQELVGRYAEPAAYRAMAAHAVIRSRPGADALLDAHQAKWRGVHRDAKEAARSVVSELGLDEHDASVETAAAPADGPLAGADIAPTPGAPAMSGRRRTLNRVGAGVFGALAIASVAVRVFGSEDKPSAPPPIKLMDDRLAGSRPVLVREGEGAERNRTATAGPSAGNQVAASAQEMPHPLDAKEERVLQKKLKRWLGSAFSGEKAEATAADDGCEWKASTIQRYKGDILATAEGSVRQGRRRATLKMMFLWQPHDEWVCVDELSLVEENGSARQLGCETMAELCESTIVFSE